MSVRGIREIEHWVGRGEMAEIMGISVRALDQLVAQGMPSETWGLRARRFKPSEVIAWAQQRSVCNNVSDKNRPGGVTSTNRAGEPGGSSSRLAASQDTAIGVASPGKEEQ